MSTMNISLPEMLKSFGDRQVAGRGFGTSSEYVRELIRRDRDREELRALAAVERQYRIIARNPGIGSPRYAGELGIEGLRVSTVTRFPRLIFYLAFEDRVEILRVLDGMRDIPASLRS